MTVSAGGPSEKTCPTCGRDVDPEDYNQDVGECDRCQDTRREYAEESTASATSGGSRDVSDYVEQEQRSTAATAVRAAARRHAEEVNAGEKSPGATAGDETDG